jgi:hypothetical protein
LREYHNTKFVYLMRSVLDAIPNFFSSSRSWPSNSYIEKHIR